MDDRYTMVRLHCIRCGHDFDTVKANAMLRICAACLSWSPVVAPPDELPPRIPKATP